MIDVINNPTIDTFGGVYKREKAVCLTIIDGDSGKAIGLPIPIDEAIDLGQELIRLAYATKYEAPLPFAKGSRPMGSEYRPNIGVYDGEKWSGKDGEA